MKKIFTNGCFDILHRGHLDLFEYAKSLGYLYVGVDSDEKVRRDKGKDRPYNVLDDRINMIIEDCKKVLQDKNNELLSITKQIILF